jgi:hypothetical protein
MGWDLCWPPSSRYPNSFFCYKRFEGIRTSFRSILDRSLTSICTTSNTLAFVDFPQLEVKGPCVDCRNSPRTSLELRAFFFRQYPRLVVYWYKDSVVDYISHKDLDALCIPRLLMTPFPGINSSTYNAQSISSSITTPSSLHLPPSAPPAPPPPPPTSSPHRHH